jgi:hypothetical protein
MMQPDPLHRVEIDSPDRPGPVGRVVRLALGFACSYALYQLIVSRSSIMAQPISVLPNLTVLVLAALFVINYVVNIGFGRSFGRWPGYLSLAIGGTFAGVAWLLAGTPDHPIFGVALWLWLAYFYAHLGGSFLIAAAFATPGCEMRAIPELVGLVTGREAGKHRCPAAFITKIDEWEMRRTRGRQ